MTLLSSVSQQAMINAQGGAPVVDADPFYYNTGLILRGEGADGNTTFVDYSAGSRPVTGYGAVKNDGTIDVAGTPSIFIEAYANYLDRDMSDAVLIDADGPDFCMEWYMRPTNVAPSLQYIMGRRRNSNDFTINLSAGDINFTTWSGLSGSTLLTFAPSPAFSNGTTYHVAICRSGDTLYGFVDGVLIGTNTPSWSMGIDRGSGSQGLYIGRSDTSTSRYFRGNLNHLRITFGTTRYNLAGFTPDAVPHNITRPAAVAPTAPADADVELLMTFDNAYGDQSDNGHLPQFEGTAQLSSAQTKFGATSLLLDGNSDYVAVSPNAAGALDTDGSSSFTMECWVYVDSLADNRPIWTERDGSAADGVTWTVRSDGALKAQMHSAGTEILDLLSEAGAISLNTWHHVALVIEVGASGTFGRQFVDGVQVDFGYLYLTASSNTGPKYIGFNDDANDYFSGHIEQFRLTRAALYTGDFTVPSAFSPIFTPAAAVNPTFANVVLLAGFEGTDGDTSYTEESGNAAAAAFSGAAQIDDAQLQFGSTSLVLGGTSSDYINFPHIADYSIDASTDWTVEGWIRPTAADIAAGNACIFNKRASSSASEWRVQLKSGQLVVDGFSGGSSVWRTEGGKILSADTWYHFAVCRDGDVIAQFIDGEFQAGTFDASRAQTNTSALQIGRSAFTTGREFAGHVDELRISHEAIYPVGGFIPPASAFPRS